MFAMVSCKVIVSCKVLEITTKRRTYRVSYNLSHFSKDVYYPIIKIKKNKKFPYLFSKNIIDHKPFIGDMTKLTKGEMIYCFLTHIIDYEKEEDNMEMVKKSWVE